MNKIIRASNTLQSEILEQDCRSQIPERAQNPQFFFLSDYMFGGCQTFTAHLLRSLNRSLVLRLNMGEGPQNRLKDFGYGIRYQTVPLNFLDRIQRPFITDMFGHPHILESLDRDDITIVIHDPGEISVCNQRYLNKWNIITIRKSMQHFIQEKFGFDTTFLYHPFYQYNIALDNDCGYAESDIEQKDRAVAISRIDFLKNTDIILNANKMVKRLYVEIYGWANGRYVASELDGLTFRKFYKGKFEKSFAVMTKILRPAKFMVDLSQLPMDGGGTQYTFLNAIYHNCAIILNRRWIEDIDPKFCDFKEGVNCYAVSDGQELAELLDSGIDTLKIVRNARKLLDRHINTEGWSKKVSESCRL